MHSTPLRNSRFSLLLALAVLCGCGSSDDDDDGIVVQTAPHSVSSTTEIAVGGVWMVYLASEALTGPPPGTELNGDGDTVPSDKVAVAVDMSTGTATELRAAERAALLGGEVFLVVNEVEDGEWDNPVSQDTVLLHWSAATATVSFVDTLDPAGAQRLIVAEEGLYYRSKAVPGAGSESSLRRIAAANPTAPPEAIAGQAGLGTTDPEILGVDENLLFLALDETAGTTDLNGDGDFLDTHVLALLDGTDSAALIQNAGVALEKDAAPIDAFLLSAGDWLIACLVDEAPPNADGQSRTNGLNDQALFSNQLDSCGTNDTDTADQVLHYVTFSGSPAVPTVVNTGVAGSDRVLAFTGFVATVSSEADTGCELNADNDGLRDDVARWVATKTPVAPVITTSLGHALKSTVKGGSFGLSRLGNRLVAVVDEADDEQNLDGKAANHDLVGWIEPSLGSPVWHFSHQSGSTSSIGTGVFDSDDVSEPFAGANWMAAEPVGDRLAVTFLEEVPGTNAKVGSLNTNLRCNVTNKDGDKTDALPVWADFAGTVLDFDGVGYSVSMIDAGIVIAGGYAFFRVSEADDNRDYNEDGVLDDMMLFRNPLTACDPVAMATSTDQGPVLASTSSNGAAFLSVEGGNLVVKYFLF